MPKRTPTGPLNVELRVRLSDGTFDTALEMPVHTSDGAREGLVVAWLGLVEKALVVAKERDP